MNFKESSKEKTRMSTQEYVCSICDDAFSYGFDANESTKHVCQNCSVCLMDSFDICPVCFSEMNDDAECLCSEKKFIGKLYSLEKIRRKFQRYGQE